MAFISGGGGGRGESRGKGAKISIPLSGPPVKCTKLEGEVSKVRALPFRLESLSEWECEVWEPHMGQTTRMISDCVPGTQEDARRRRLRGGLRDGLEHLEMQPFVLKIR